MATSTDTAEEQRCTSFIIEPINEGTVGTVNGYFVKSTAPINVEERPEQGEDPGPGIEFLAQRLLQADNPEITISIHGYGTRHKDAKVRYRKILNDANTLYEGKDKSGSVFMGYLWPSEPINASLVSGFCGALNSLPTLLTILLGGSLAVLLGNFAFLLFHSFVLSIIVFVLVSLLIQGLAGTLEIVSSNPLSLISFLGFGVAVYYGLILRGLDRSFSLAIWVWASASIVTAVIVGVILALLLLRLSNYLRDSYRASNYAVTDLVDLAQLLDQKLTEQDPGNTKKVKLNFIAHSMGCFVTTNVIRIVSDAFQKTSETYYLGNRLALGRLILVAPDISIQTIMPGRSNLFSYALTRFKETYVFSNEGDLALRLASTAANYIRFPAKTRFMGYRLGCITAKHFENKQDTKNAPDLSRDDYGIINLTNPHQPSPDSLTLPHKMLSVRASNQEHCRLLELEPEGIKKTQFTPESVVNTFTYFDCTDYKDVKIQYEQLADVKEGNEPGAAATQASDSADEHSATEQATADQPSADSGATVNQGAANDKTVGIVSNALSKKALGLRNYVRLAWDYFVPAKIGFIPTGSRSINTHGGYFNGTVTFNLITGLAFVGFQECCQRLGMSSSSSAIGNLHDACQQKGIQVIISPNRLNP